MQIYGLLYTAIKLFKCIYFVSYVYTCMHNYILYRNSVKVKIQLFHDHFTYISHLFCYIKTMDGNKYINFFLNEHRVMNVTANFVTVRLNTSIMCYQRL